MASALWFVGDVGATKADLALFEKQPQRLQLVREAQLASADGGDMATLCEKFLGADLKRVDAGCLSVAGVVQEDTVWMPNLGWQYEPREIRRRLGMDRLYFLNDLLGMAYGVPTQLKESLLVLQAGKPQTGNKALIAAGTGLGEALLAQNGDAGWLPLASEGGHADFAADDVWEMQLREVLLKRHGHVSYERLLSGSGLEAIYAQLCAKPPVSVTAAWISEQGLSGKEPLCEQALRRFVAIYGREAGNLALKSLALGGLYVGGGMALKLLPLLQDGTFVEAFNAKGRYRALMQSIPVKVLLNPKVALEGGLNLLLSRHGR